MQCARCQQDSPSGVKVLRRQLPATWVSMPWPLRPAFQATPRTGVRIYDWFTEAFDTNDYGRPEA